MRNSLYQALVNRLNAKHQKLSSRFYKSLKEGSFKNQSSRNKYQTVDRLKKLEKRLVRLGRQKDNRFALSFKHWALALAMGVVVTTASAQDKKETFASKLNSKQAKTKTYTAPAAKLQALTFTPSFQLGEATPQAIHTGDFDGDGDTDILYVPYVSGPFIMFNQGAFSFTKGNALVDEVIVASEVKDIDADGDLDIIYRNYPNNQDAVLLNEGTGNFAAPAATTIPGSYYVSGKYGDVDRDGDLDFIPRTYDYSDGFTSSGFSVYLNNALNFVGATGNPYIATGSGKSRAIDLADLDGDGDLDVSVQHTSLATTGPAPYYNYYPGQTSFEVFLNDGNGNLQDARLNLNPVEIYSGSLISGDIDGDGDVDALWNAFGRNYPIINDGVGGFAVQNGITTYQYIDFRNAEFLDVNNDGPADLLSDGFLGDSVIFHQGNGEGSFTEVFKLRSDLGDMGDLDNDGDLDLVNFLYNVQLQQQVTGFAFETVNNELLTVSQSNDMEVVDIDGDGSLDIVQNGKGGSKIWLGNGTGANFTESQVIGGLDVNTGELGDFDNDSDLDLVRIGVVPGSYGSSNQIEILTNTSGNLTNVSTTPTNYSGHIQLADVDNDGDLDILFLGGGYSTKYLSVFSNDGAGNFAASAYTQIPGTFILDYFEVGDIDGDSDLDIVGNAETYGIFTMINDGGGAFTYGSSYRPSADFVNVPHINLFDVDGDGDLDVFALNSQAGYSFVLLNDAAGNFSRGTDVSISYSVKSAYADMDNDGDVDIVMGGYLSNPQLFINDGTGVFTKDSDIPLFVDEYAMPDFGDVDGDGDLDMVFSGYYTQNVVILNDLINTATLLDADSTVLLSLYETNGGPNWNNSTNWLSGDVSTWYGVTVRDNRITKLDLPDNNLTGNLTTDIIGLDALDSLNLSGNELDRIPELSRLTNLLYADVSNNNLQFPSLIPNTVLNNFIYAPQDSVGSGEEFFGTVGGTVRLTETVSGVGNIYQWFKDGVAIPQATTNSLSLGPLQRSDIASYYLQATNLELPELTLYSRMDEVFVTATVSGSLTDEASNGVGNTEVALLRVTSANGFDTTNVVTSNEDGSFIFNQVVLDDYQVLANTDEVALPDLIPSYFPNFIFWEDADTLSIIDNLTGVNIVVQAIPPAPEGFGGIRGVVYEDIPDGRLSARKRVAKAGVSVRRRVPGGRQGDPGKGRLLQHYELVTYLKSNAQGEFDFSNLPEGTYRLNVQYPGYPMDTTSNIDITITSGTPFDEQKSVEAEVIDGKIVVRDLTVVAVEVDPYYEELNVYPNPTTGILSLHIPELVKLPLTARIYDLSGKELFIKELKDEHDNIDLTRFEKGIYILRITDDSSEEKASVHKIIIE